MHSSVLKIDKVVPVLKRLSRLPCNSYRPISLLSKVNKIIQNMMPKRLNKSYPKKDAFTIYNLVLVGIVLQVMHSCRLYRISRLT